MKKYNKWYIPANKRFKTDDYSNQTFHQFKFFPGPLTDKLAEYDHDKVYNKIIYQTSN